MRQDRGIGNAHNAQVEPEGKGEAAPDVDQIDRNGREHRNHGILHPRKPTVKAEEQDACRHSPNAGVEVFAGHLVAVHCPEGRLAERNLQYDKQQTQSEGDDERSRQHIGTFGVVLRAVGLGRQTTRAHADERAVPVDKVKDRCADGQRTNRGRRIDPPVARNSRRSNTHHRYGNVRDDVGHSQA